MKITKHTVPSVTYLLQVGGEKIDQADESNPLVYLAGVGMMIPGFEKELEGMSEGDTFDFHINADDAYGQHNPEAVVPLPMDTFEVDGSVDKEIIKVGATIPMSDQDGNPLHGLIVNMDETHVTMDFNHMLAGKDLHFTGKVINVREASKEELEHGHVHGPDGHHH